MHKKYSTKIKQQGFTLIEVMIVVAIIAIIATIAIPNYRSYVVRSYRAQAISILQANMLALEQYKTRNINFPTATQVSNGVVAGYRTSTNDTGQSQGYNITYAINTNIVTLTMTPNTAFQSSETLCRTMTLNSNEVQTAVNSSGTDTTSSCWANNSNAS